jgi:hypothetical protein
MLDPASRPRVQLVPAVEVLARYQVTWVLTGSMVAAIYGAELVPNDLDVTPSLDAGNLDRLANALQDLQALPAFIDGWTEGPSRRECEQWRPLPASEENLDHLFVTRLGMVDVPPRLCGTYDELAPACATIHIGSVPVQVCDPDEVLTRLAGRTRPKDLVRAAAYDQLRQQPAADRRPIGVARLMEQLP